MMIPIAALWSALKVRRPAPLVLSIDVPLVLDGREFERVMMRILAAIRGEAPSQEDDKPTVH